MLLLLLPKEKPGVEELLLPNIDVLEFVVGIVPNKFVVPVAFPNPPNDDKLPLLLLLLFDPNKPPEEFPSKPPVVFVLVVPNILVPVVIGAPKRPGVLLVVVVAPKAVGTTAGEVFVPKLNGGEGEIKPEGLTILCDCGIFALTVGELFTPKLNAMGGPEGATTGDVFPPKVKPEGVVIVWDGGIVVGLGGIVVCVKTGLVLLTNDPPELSGTPNKPVPVVPKPVEFVLPPKENPVFAVGAAVVVVPPKPNVVLFLEVAVGRGAPKAVGG